ncbi:hypothetical protein EYF80_038557 [Liparis tanakae]|uniref:Uncharacterized protein n=1 Tax=Liparis tanakae TaxID=230148 RepID=A0A4Z2GCF2_9TELE|nr:hypothetical protein EYF80_038557 [Liparis tanakae]
MAPQSARSGRSLLRYTGSGLDASSARARNDSLLMVCAKSAPIRGKRGPRTNPHRYHTRLLRRVVHVGYHGDDRDDVLGRRDGGLNDALLNAPRRQPGLGLVVPALLDGLAQHGQTLQDRATRSGTGGGGSMDWCMMGNAVRLTACFCQHSLRAGLSFLWTTTSCMSSRDG